YGHRPRRLSRRVASSGRVPMRTILLASAAAVLMSAVAANAADLRPAPAPVMPTKAPPFVPLAFDWSGFYVGVNGGGGWGRSWSGLTGGFQTYSGGVGGTAGWKARCGGRGSCGAGGVARRVDDA